MAFIIWTAEIEDPVADLILDGAPCVLYIACLGAWKSFTLSYLSHIRLWVSGAFVCRPKSCSSEGLERFTRTSHRSYISRSRPTFCGREDKTNHGNKKRNYSLRADCPGPKFTSVYSGLNNAHAEDVQLDHPERSILMVPSLTEHFLFGDI